MDLRFVFGTFFLVAIMSCSYLEIETDFNPEYDFSSLKKVCIIYPSPSEGTITLAQQRFGKAIEQEIATKGFIITDKDQADFLILFHLNVTTKREVVLDYQMAGIYPYYPYYWGYGYWPGFIPVEREYTYEEGKIIIDAVDPNGNKIFWRGVATDRLKSFDTPQERIKYIQKVVSDILKSFPPQDKPKKASGGLEDKN